MFKEQLAKIFYTWFVFLNPPNNAQQCFSTQGAFAIYTKPNAPYLAIKKYTYCGGLKTSGGVIPKDIIICLMEYILYDVVK